MDPRLERIKKEVGNYFAETAEAEAHAKREYLEADAARIEAEKQLLEESGIIGLLQEIRDSRLVMFSESALATVEVTIPEPSLTEERLRQHATVLMVFNDASYTDYDSYKTIKHDQIKIQAVDGSLLLEVPCSHHETTPSTTDWANKYYRLSHRYDLQVIDPMSIDEAVIEAIKFPVKYSSDMQTGLIAIKK